MGAHQRLSVFKGRGAAAVVQGRWQEAAGQHEWDLPAGSPSEITYPTRAPSEKPVVHKRVRGCEQKGWGGRVRKRVRRRGKKGREGRAA